MKRKVIASLLISAMLLSLVGCGKKEVVQESTETKQETTKKSTDEKKETSSAKVPELTWYLFGDEPIDNESVQAEFDKYFTDRIGATVKLNYIPGGDFNQKMTVKINSGEKYDLTFTSSWCNDFVTNALRGAYAPMDELLKETPDLASFIPDFLWDVATVNGNIYAMPNYKDVSGARYNIMKSEYLDKYNLDINDFDTLESMEPAFKAIKDNEPTLTPFGLKKEGYDIYMGHYDMILDIYVPLGFNLESNELVNVFEDDTTMGRLEVLRDYYEKGYISPDAATIEEDIRKTPIFMFNDQGFPYADSIWSEQVGAPVRSVVRKVPVTTTSTARGAMHAISSSSDHQVEAMKVLEAINTDSFARNLIAYGVEGKHYTKVSDTQIEKIPDTYSGYLWSTGTFYGGLYTLASDPVDKWDAIKEWVDNSVPSPLIGFSFDQEPVMNELAAIRNVTRKYYPLICTGTVDPQSEVPKMLEELENAGFSKVKEEALRQIEEWKKTK